MKSRLFDIFGAFAFIVAIFAVTFVVYPTKSEGAVVSTSANPVNPPADLKPQSPLERSGESSSPTSEKTRPSDATRPNSSIPAVPPKPSPSFVPSSTAMIDPFRSADLGTTKVRPMSKANSWLKGDLVVTTRRPALLEPRRTGIRTIRPAARHSVESPLLRASNSPIPTPVNAAKVDIRLPASLVEEGEDFWPEDLVADSRKPESSGLDPLAESGLSAQDTSLSGHDQSDSAEIIAPFAVDPNSTTTILAGGKSLWRTSNAGDQEPAWNSIRPAGSAPISAIAVAPGNSARIYVGQIDGTVATTSTAMSDAPTWTTLGSGTLPNRGCTRLVVSREDPNLVYATFDEFSASNVWASRDAGASWVSIAGAGSGALPVSPVYAIAQSEENSKTLYVITAMGLYVSKNGGDTWSAIQAVDEATLENLNPATKLVASTHGKGIWLVGANGPRLSTLTLTQNEVVGGSTVTAVVTLESPAPAAGARVAVCASGENGARFPESVTIPAGSIQASFPIETRAASETHSASITVQLGNASLSQGLTIAPHSTQSANAHSDNPKSGTPAHSELDSLPQTP